MSHVRLYYHLVIVTRNRENVIPPTHEKQLYKYIHTMCIDRNISLLRINGTPCHIHMLLSLPPSVCVSDLVRDIKRATSMMMQRTPAFLHFKGWSREYSCDTVSFHHVDMVRNYIINQKTHHSCVDLTTEMNQLFGHPDPSAEDSTHP